MQEIAFPKAPCTFIVDTEALTRSLYRYFKAEVYIIWVHGALGIRILKRFGVVASKDFWVFAELVVASVQDNRSPRQWVKPS